MRPYKFTIWHGGNVWDDNRLWRLSDRYDHPVDDHVGHWAPMFLLDWVMRP